MQGRRNKGLWVGYFLLLVYGRINSGQSQTGLINPLHVEWLSIQPTECAAENFQLREVKQLQNVVAYVESSNH